MKLHLYKVLGFNPDMEQPQGFDAVDSIMVLTADGLREEFLRAYNSGYISYDIISDYEKDPDYQKEDWNDIGNLSCGTMADIMNDLAMYNARFWYYVCETDV